MKMYWFTSFMMAIFVLFPQVPVFSLNDNSSKIITYISTQQYNADLTLFNLEDGSKVRPKQPNSNEYSPAWSSDGCSLAYTSNKRNDVLSDIFIISSDKPEAVNVTEPLHADASVFSYPSWSPDGKKLSFASNMGEGFGLYILNLVGMSIFRAADTSLLVSRSDWSPDGTKIAFGAEVESKQDIYTVDTDGSNLKNITNSIARDTDPSWSPDGSQLVFSSDQDGNWEIYVMDADGSNLKRLTVDNATDEAPDWSPDGKRIVFSSLRTGNWEIYVMDADGSNLKQVTDEPYVSHETPRWQPAVCKSFVDSFAR